MAHLLQTSKIHLTRPLILGLLVVSIGFGFFKQIKTFVRSQEAYRIVSAEPGERARLLRLDLEKKLFAVEIEKKRLGYFQEPRSRPRAAEEYFYDAQYGVAPYHFVWRDKNAEIIFSE